jgi:hypothetical protein
MFPVTALVAWPWSFRSSGSSSSALTFTSADAMRAIRRIGEKIHSDAPDGMRAGGSWVKPSPTCKLAVLGKTQYGQHHICNRSFPMPCVALTYGVQNEYSFELDVRKKFGCRVFALDPTVNHKAELAPGVHFLKWAAPSPVAATDVARYNSAHDAETSSWFRMPPPLLAGLVARNTSIPLLKMVRSLTPPPATSRPRVTL